jgi:HD-GYP domain-containing protein (c-di-GMP phosphodiesterase class II)
VVTLNVGQDFKQRWLATPLAVRQVYLDDLARICDLLQPEMDSHKWLEQDQRAIVDSETRIQQGYLDYQAELLAAKRLRERLALEAKLAQKRALAKQKEAELALEEQRKQQAQNQLLNVLRQQQAQALTTYIARYQKNPEQNYPHFNKAFKVPDTSMLSELESVRLRLELEAESMIESKVAELRRMLQAAAKEEIALALKNSSFQQDENVENLAQMADHPSDKT